MVDQLFQDVEKSDIPCHDATNIAFEKLRERYFNKTEFTSTEEDVQIDIKDKSAESNPVILHFDSDFSFENYNIFSEFNVRPGSCFDVSRDVDQNFFYDPRRLDCYLN